LNAQSYERVTIRIPGAVSQPTSTSTSTDVGPSRTSNKGKRKKADSVSESQQGNHKKKKDTTQQSSIQKSGEPPLLCPFHLSRLKAKPRFSPFL
jgi:hypothetical protein